MGSRRFSFSTSRPSSAALVGMMKNQSRWKTNAHQIS
jgi:hypothetical protein